MGRDTNRAGGAVKDFNLGEARAEEFGVEHFGILLLSQREDARLPSHRLLKSEFGVVSGG